MTIPVSNVGILNLDFYCPSEYVEQSELEQFDGVSPGKYLIGLGQTRMGICSDREDIHSLCLTVLHRLLEKTGLTTKDIGFLMVGTETLLDKSKSIKSVLMQLFEESGNYDVQGIDTTNACFGGTASLHHAVDWVESTSYDGRKAVVICADIAVYAEGPARPTGGAGAVAMLVGPDAPMVIDPKVRTHYMRNTYDFYKPDFNSEYPVVDGKQSISCYMDAVFHCYKLFRDKYIKVTGSDEVTLAHFDGLIFHAPYCKIVSKALARLVFQEFQSCPDPEETKEYAGLGLHRFREATVEETAFDRDFETAFVKLGAPVYDSKVKPSLTFATEVGNMYTASVYACLVSYLSSKPLEQLAGKKALIFSYGSGLAASMFSVSLSSDITPGSGMSRLHKSAKEAADRLEQRIKITPAIFNDRLKQREKDHGKAPFIPVEDESILFPGTYFLNEVDANYRRTYSRKPVGPAVSNGKKE